jgi:Actinobacteria/chloroflexi VLRF1 release factor
VVNNVAGGGVRWVDLPPERFPGWISSFAVRHGDPAAAPGPDLVTFTAPDGARAECHPPFAESFRCPPGDPAGPPGDLAPAALAAALAAHAAAPRTVGVLLVRLGGYAAGVFTGYPPSLRDGKTGARPVHGRSAAGGWSQQRFARRRSKQADEALRAAADTAAAVFGRWQDHGPPMDAVVLGGDKRAVAGLRDDPRLAPYLAVATERFITVPDPRRSVLEAAPAQFTAVRIKVTEPQS